MGNSQASGYSRECGDGGVQLQLRSRQDQFRRLLVPLLKTTSPESDAEIRRLVREYMADGVLHERVDHPDGEKDRPVIFIVRARGLYDVLLEYIRSEHFNPVIPRSGIGMSFIMVVVRDGWSEGLEALLARGLRTDEVNNSGETALMAAIAYDRKTDPPSAPALALATAMALRLLDTDCNPFAMARGGQSALSVAISRGMGPVVEKLVRIILRAEGTTQHHFHTREYEKRTMWSGAPTEYLFGILLQTNLHNVAREYIESKWYDPATAPALTSGTPTYLLEALKYGASEVAIAIVRRGGHRADVPNGEGRSALELACGDPKLEEVAETLLDEVVSLRRFATGDNKLVTSASASASGAGPFTVSDFTAFNNAVRRGSTQLVNHFIRVLAPDDIIRQQQDVGRDGKTALVTACEAGRADVALLLIPEVYAGPVGAITRMDLQAVQSAVDKGVAMTPVVRALIQRLGPLGLFERALPDKWHLYYALIYLKMFDLAGEHLDSKDYDPAKAPISTGGYDYVTYTLGRTGPRDLAVKILQRATKFDYVVTNGEARWKNPHLGKNALLLAVFDRSDEELALTVLSKLEGKLTIDDQNVMILSHCVRHKMFALLPKMVPLVKLASTELRLNQKLYMEESLTALTLACTMERADVVDLLLQELDFDHDALLALYRRVGRPLREVIARHRTLNDTAFLIDKFGIEKAGLLGQPVPDTKAVAPSQPAPDATKA